MIKELRTLAPERGTYVWVRLVPESVKLLTRAIHAARPGVIDIHDTRRLHCTLLHSVYHVPEHVSKMIIEPSRIHEATIKGSQLLGKNKESLVLDLDSESLIEKHKQWIETGAEHLYPEFIPHVSISYNYIDNGFGERLLQELEGEDIFLTGESYTRVRK